MANKVYKFWDTNIIDVCQIQITHWWEGGGAPNTTLFNSPSTNFPNPQPQLPKVTIHLKEIRFQNVKAIQRHITAELNAIP